MACCKVCCGCADCTEGQPGKCCCGGPTGECCQTGEYCCQGVCQPTPCGLGACCDPFFGCYESTQMECWGFWQGPGTTCDPNPCVECNADGDCPEGTYCCDNTCQPEPCPRCNGVAVTGCNIGASQCGSGAQGGSECYDPLAPQQSTTPPLNCLDGTPASVTVTGAGYVAFPGSTGVPPAYIAFIESLMNASYGVSFVPPHCNGSRQVDFYVDGGPGIGPHSISVLVDVASMQYAAIVVRISPSGAIMAVIEQSLGANDYTLSSCGTPLYHCEGFSFTTGNGSITVS